MNSPDVRTPQLERLVASLLQYGTWLASIAIGLGFALALIDSMFGTRNLAMIPDMRLAEAGIALFILLPSLRVLVMLIVFLRERDYWLGFIAAVVLSVILLGFALGIRSASPSAG